MTAEQQAALRDIREKQAALRSTWALLEKRIATLEASLAPAAAPVHSLGVDVPPPLAAPAAGVLPMPAPASPVPAPRLDPEPAVPASSLPDLPSLPAPAAARANVDSLEMQIGTKWLVRASIVLLLTSLAFFGNYLYHHIVPYLGPLAKIGLFYLGAGALAAFGAGLERSRQAQAQESLRNYARVVLAGGLAAVYYVTYAAHWNPHLRVIDSAVLAGGLLLGWAAFMAWLADRRDSELLASLAILLAYYTSAINEITSFTLVSNLFLSAAAVLLLRRHLWRIFPFASVLATYGSYGFWRYFHFYTTWRGWPGELPSRQGQPAGAFWVEGTFLLLYWLLFTWAVFTADDRVLPGRRRASFVSVNNTAFFLLTTWLLLADYPGSFWKWSLLFGTVLLVLAETCRRVRGPIDTETEDSYLLQGLLLVTLGFIDYFSGWQLGLVLAVQSVTLLALANLRQSSLLLGASALAALLSFRWGMERLGAGTWIIGAAEGAFLVFNAWQGQRMLAKSGESTTFRSLLSWAPGFNSLLGLVVWFWLFTLRITGEATYAPVMAGAAVLLTASIYLLRVPAIPIYAQGYLLAAYCQWLEVYLLRGPRPELPLWNPLSLLAATLALGHWWQWQRHRKPAAPASARVGVDAWNACLLVGLLYIWLSLRHGAPDAFWVAETAILSLAVLGYGVFTRWRTLAAAGQLLLVASGWHFLGLWQHPWSGFGAEMWLSLIPLLATLATLVIGRRYLATAKGAGERIGLCYEIAALALFLLWGDRYFPPQTRFSLFCAAGSVLLALACVYRVRRWLLLSIAPIVAGVLIFWLAEGELERRNLFHVLGIVCLAAGQQFSRRRLGQEAVRIFPVKAQSALITVDAVCGWGLVTARMSDWRGGTFGLAASWSIYAAFVFGVGLVLRERVYRWLGLIILVATLSRVICVDIWQIDLLARALTLLTLGLVLLGLGFFYTRYGSKLRDLF